MADCFRFLNWKVYKEAREIFIEITRIVRKLPADIRYTLGSQIIRSALSIMLNIAEGSGRGTDKELNRFFDISIGSVNETVSALDGLVGVGEMTEEQFTVLFTKLKSVSRQLGGFKESMKL